MQALSDAIKILRLFSTVKKGVEFSTPYPSKRAE